MPPAHPELVARMVQGDRTAVAALYERHKLPLFALARTCCAARPRRKICCTTCFSRPGAAAGQGVGVSGERAGVPALRLVFGEPASDRAALTEPATDEPVAEHWGVNVHAKECVDGRDRRPLQRLCRCLPRGQPPIFRHRVPHGRDAPENCTGSAVTCPTLASALHRFRRSNFLGAAPRIRQRRAGLHGILRLARPPNLTSASA